MSKPFSLRWPAELVQRIDDERGLVPRSAWLRAVAEERLGLAPHRSVTPAGDGSRPVGSRRPARDVTTPERVADVQPSKYDLDMERQRKLNARKGATKR